MREIRYQLAGPIATVTIDRPEKRGAMTYAMLEEFSGFVARAGAEENVRVLIVTGGSWQLLRRDRPS
jgi:2-(1,2-epoxy-1,2-dihydrophenyl)acetyl-CoA isomerase